MCGKERSDWQLRRQRLETKWKDNFAKQNNDRRECFSGNNSRNHLQMNK